MVKMSTAALDLPPGFRFHPTDEELVKHYLCRKCASQPIGVPIIAEIDLYKYDPWDLPGMALYGEKEWYFFSPRERKYPNGSRPNRAAGTGYWKATGADKPIGQPRPLGIKKALVFYSGKAPKGEKPIGLCTSIVSLTLIDPFARKNSLRLDDWVLCRIYNKKGVIEKQPAATISNWKKTESMDLVEEDRKPEIMPPPPLLPSASAAVATINEPPSDYMYFEASDSMPKLHTDSSCSEHVVSPEFTSEVQSEPKWNDWGSGSSVDFAFKYIDSGMDNIFASQFQGNTQMSPLQDMFMYLPKSL